MNSADRGTRIARGTTRAILLLDLLAGVAWLAGDPTRSTVPVFNPARRLLHGVARELGTDPARIWGSLLVVVAAAALAAMFGRSEGLTRGLLVILCGYWTFWLVLDGVAAVTEANSSLTAPFTIGIILVGHIRQAIGPNILTRRAAPDS